MTCGRRHRFNMIRMDEKGMSTLDFPNKTVYFWLKMHFFKISLSTSGAVAYRCSVTQHDSVSSKRTTPFSESYVASERTTLVFNFKELCAPFLRLELTWGPWRHKRNIFMWKRHVCIKSATYSDALNEQNDALFRHCIVRKLGSKTHAPNMKTRLYGTIIWNECLWRSPLWRFGSTYQVPLRQNYIRLNKSSVLAVFSHCVPMRIYWWVLDGVISCFVEGLSVRRS